MGSAKGNSSVANTSASPTPRRMSKDLRRNREQRQKVFEAIAKVISSQGPGIVTMDNIAAKMGGSKGTIYYYFKSKGDMLYQMQMYAYDLVHEAVYPILDDKTIPPRERLERTIYSQALVMCNNWQLWRAMWMDVAIPHELNRVLKRRRTYYERRLTELVEEVIQTEGWRCIEPKTVARVITGLLDSISRWYKKGGRFSAEEIAALAVKSALYGPFEWDRDLRHSPESKAF
ncbi:MAG: TetR/AcrR family transcriptional regulator [Chloroflexota bacterium]|mgnify:CR=1 FL=1